MKRTVLVGMLCLMVISSVDADSLRSRRARRRASRQTTNVQRSWSRNNYRAPTTYRTTTTPMTSNSQVYPNAISSTPVVSEPTVISSSPAATPTYVTPQRVTTYKPVLDDVPAAPSETSTPAIDSVPAVPTPVDSNVVPSVDEVLTPIPDVVPTADGSVMTSEGQPFCASCTVTPANQPFNSALTELNMIRARRGLRALVEDASLSAIAYRKASIQANRGVMYHPGGTMGGARFEGVGMGRQFTTCYQDARNVQYAGAATVVGRNGQRYHCLLIR